MEHLPTLSRQVTRSKFRPYSLNSPSIFVFYKNYSIAFDDFWQKSNYFFAKKPYTTFYEDFVVYIDKLTWFNEYGCDSLIRSILFVEKRDY